MSPLPRSSQAGVSLIETLAALAIIALVTGVAVVMLQPEDSPAQLEGDLTWSGRAARAVPGLDHVKSVPHYE